VQQHPASRTHAHGERLDGSGLGRGCVGESSASSVRNECCGVVWLALAIWPAPTARHPTSLQQPQASQSHEVRSRRPRFAVLILSISLPSELVLLTCYILCLLVSHEISELEHNSTPHRATTVACELLPTCLFRHRGRDKRSFIASRQCLPAIDHHILVSAPTFWAGTRHGWPL
jgi:hypothetical protein